MIAVLARVVAAALVFFQQASHWTSDKPEEILKAQTTHPITGLILARGGSKGIPNKNIQPLMGIPMIRWSIDAMIKSGGQWILVVVLYVLLIILWSNWRIFQFFRKFGYQQMTQR